MIKEIIKGKRKENMVPFLIGWVSMFKKSKVCLQLKEAQTEVIV